MSPELPYQKSILVLSARAGPEKVAPATSAPITANNEIRMRFSFEDVCARLQPMLRALFRADQQARRIALIHDGVMNQIALRRSPIPLRSAAPRRRVQRDR